MNKLKSETDYIPGLWDLDLAAEVVKMNKAPPPFKHTRSKSVNNSSEFMAKRGVNQTSIALAEAVNSQSAAWRKKKNQQPHHEVEAKLLGNHR
jgi:hypothetical protein